MHRQYERSWRPRSDPGASRRSTHSTTRPDTEGNPPLPVVPNTVATSQQERPSAVLWRQGVAWYAEKLDTHPYLTKGITSGIIAASGDLLCQSISSSLSTTAVNAVFEEGEENTLLQNRRDDRRSSASWDVGRTLRFGLLGAVYVAPGCHGWYGALARWYPLSTTTRARHYGPVVQRVAADQFLFTPVFLMGWLSLLWTLEWMMPTVPPVAHLTMPTTTETPPRLPPSNDTHTVPSLLDWVRDKFGLTDMVQILTANWLLWIPVQALNFSYIPTKFQVLVSNGVALLWNTYLSYMTSRSNASPPPPPVVSS
jgi:Mpv17 / PMP22 family